MVSSFSSCFRYSVLVTQSCPTLCNPMDFSPPGSSLHGILQARILERIAISSSRGFFQLRERTCISSIAGGFFTTEPQGNPLKEMVQFSLSVVSDSLRPHAQVKLRPILCDPMDCSLPGFSVHGILQARILEWVATAFLQESFPTQK